MNIASLLYFRNLNYLWDYIVLWDAFMILNSWNNSVIQMAYSLMKLYTQISKNIIWWGFYLFSPKWNSNAAVFLFFAWKCGYMKVNEGLAPNSQWIREPILVTTDLLWSACASLWCVDLGLLPSTDQGALSPPFNSTGEKRGWESSCVEFRMGRAASHNHHRQNRFEKS